MLGSLELFGSDAAVPLGEPKEITSRRAFFETDFGSLAVLPQANSKDTAKQAGDFLLLRTCRVNTIRRNESIWFQFNHHNNDEAATNATHVGIMVIKVVKNQHTLPISVHRNNNWIRPGEKQTLNSLDKQLDVPWNEFAVDLRNWSASPNNLLMSDAVIGGPWHATPSGGNYYSWEYRRFWPLAADNFKATVANVTHKPLEPEKVCVNAQLLRFTPTPLPSSRAPMVFEVGASDSECVFIATYCPPLEGGAEDVENWWWIRFR
jgi:hypothetical protein